MPITSITKDAETLSLTVVADFSVTQQRLWDAWADPRQLERFWGPPFAPATFTHHDFRVGGRAEYVLTGPDEVVLEPVFTFHGFRYAEVTGAADNHLTGWLQSRLDHMERVLKAREWLAADRFTVADLLMADVLRVEKVRAFGDRPLQPAAFGSASAWPCRCFTTRKS